MPFEPRQRLEAVERLGVGDVGVLGAAHRRAATRARARPPRSRARPRSSASARCCRPRPAGRTCACPAARRRCRRRTARRGGPGAIRSPPASTPISRTPASSMNASKMPMALLPPPTQATTTSGRRPACSSICCARLAADHRLELAHHQRIRMRAERRAEQVVGVVDVGDPVAHRLVDRVLQRPAAGVDAAHRRRRAAACGRR